MFSYLVVSNTFPLFYIGISFDNITWQYYSCPVSNFGEHRIPIHEDFLMICIKHKTWTNIAGEGEWRSTSGTLKPWLWRHSKSNAMDRDLLNRDNWQDSMWAYYANTEMQTCDLSSFLIILLFYITKVLLSFLNHPQRGWIVQCCYFCFSGQMEKIGVWDHHKIVWHS